MNIDQTLSTKNEIIFNKINNGTRILLKLKTNCALDLK